MNLSDIDVLNPDVYRHGIPHDQFAFLREHAPVFRQPVNEPGMIDSAWVLTRYSDVKAAMTSLDGQEHHRNRRLVSQGFTTRAIGAFEDSFRQLAAAIVERAVAKESFDFVTDVAVELPMQVICNLMGVPDEDRYKVLAWSNTVASPMDPEYSPSPEAQLAAVHGLWDYGFHLASLRRDSPGRTSSRS